jgi:uncharacterized protein involved in outer membrane biogenesis
LRKLLFAAGFLALAVLAAIVAAPWLVDAGQYRGEIARRVSLATGREVAIDGPVAFVLLPSPRVRASAVRVVSGETDFPLSIDARHVELDLGWASLFGGAVEITHLRVIEPRVVIAAAPAAGAAPVPRLGPIETVRIERTDIQNGRIVWTDPQSKTPRTVEQIQASVLASPLASSIRIAGTAVASAVPLEFDAVIGDAPAGRPNPVSLTASIRPNLARAMLRGTYDAGTGSLRGRLQAEGGDLLAALDVTGIQVDSAIAGPVRQPFTATGDLAWTAAGIAANDLVLQVGEVRATGAVNATLGHTAAVDVALALAWLDLDKLSRLEPRAPAPPAQRPPPPPANGATTRVESSAAPRPRASEKILDLALDLGVEAVGLNGGIVRQLRLNAVMSRGDLVINQASALLPGGTELTGFAQIDIDEQPARIEGTVAARSDNLRGLLHWLGIDTSDVPAGRLRRFETQARVEGTPARIELTGFNLAFDSTRATGGVTIAPGARVGLGVDLKVDQINIDGYSAAAMPGGPAATAKPAGTSSFAIVDRFDANLALAADTVTVGGETINGAVVDATLQRGDVVLRRLEIRDLAGARVEASGNVTAVSRQAVADLQIGLSAGDGSRLLRLVDLTASAPAPLSLAGRVKGPAGGDMEFEAVDLAYDGARLVGRGRLTQKPSRRMLLDLRAERLAVDPFARIVADDDASLGVDAIVHADAIAFGLHEIGKARLEAHVDGGAPTAVDLTGTFHDGALEFTLRSEGQGRAKLNGTVSLRDADLAKALSALLDVKAIGGRGDFRAAFSAPSRRVADIWPGLSGSLEFKGRDGAIEGIDLPLMRDMLDPNDPPADVVALLGAGLHGGATTFSALDAAATVQDGKLVVNTLRIATPVGDATGGGGADLGRGTLDLWLAVPVGAPDVPPVRLQLGGRIDDARIAVDFSQLQSYLMQRNARTPGQLRGGGNQ